MGTPAKDLRVKPKAKTCIAAKASVLYCTWRIQMRSDSAFAKLPWSSLFYRHKNSCWPRIATFC